MRPRPTRIARLPLTAGILLALGTGACAAQGPEADRWALCPPVPVSPAPPATPPGAAGSIELLGEVLEAEEDGLAEVIGDVQATRAGMRVEGAQAEYDRQEQVLRVLGGVRFRSEGLSVTGDRARVDLAEDSGEVEDARFHFIDYHGFGNAGVLRFQGQQHAELERADFTSCPPGVGGWRLDADRIVLDRPSNTAEVWDATLEFHGAKVLWLPYLNFPLQGRKSGFLIPSYGTSGETGLDIMVPYYFNLAPNRDATLIPRYTGRRGLMLMGEYRYLFEASEGQLNYQYLPDDNLSGNDRAYGEFAHEHRFGRWYADLAYREVSDPNFFDDFGNTQSGASLTHLERHLLLATGGSGWSLSALAQDYQAVTDAEAYSRLPQLRFDWGRPPLPGRLHYALGTELAHFEHAKERPTGTRLHLKPELSLPLQGTAWFLRPRVALSHTEYLLDGTDEERISRTLPITSLDGGLFFERDLEMAGTPLVQTLEPRLYYLYVPYEDQQDIPLFDTDAYTFGFYSLFRENRFSGADRIGDANQLTLALSSRLIRPDTGAELARASIGQIRYFDEREVTLHGGDPIEEDGSDLVAELATNPFRGLSLSTAVQWDPDHSRDELFSTRVEFSPGRERRVLANYRFRRDQLRQTDLVAFWPLSHRWQGLLRWNYDLREGRNLDTALGVEYRSCCWAFRIMARELLNSTTGEHDTSVYFSIALKGLGEIGQSLEAELERDILGYSEP